MATVNPFPPEKVPERAVIELRGHGILGFLDNILTCSVANLIQGQIAYGALLSPQGKILHDMFVHHGPESVLLDCGFAGRHDLLAKLKLYRLRAKFEMLLRDDLSVVAGGGSAIDPRHAGLGARMICADAPLAGQAYDAIRYALGIADSAEIGNGKLFPHEANFDLLNAVDFAKGCYIGQEVVSRMQHRATTRSRILPLTFQNDQYADEIRIEGTLVGEVLGRRGSKALALLWLDRLAKHSRSLPFETNKPDWMPDLVTVT